MRPSSLPKYGYCLQQRGSTRMHISKLPTPALQVRQQTKRNRCRTAVSIAKASVDVYWKRREPFLDDGSLLHLLVYRRRPVCLHNDAK